MTRDDEATRTVSISVTWKRVPGRELLVPLGRGVLVPRRFELSVDATDLPFVAIFDVEVVDERAEVGGISLKRREDDPPINARSLREVPFKRFLEAGLVQAGIPVETPPSGRGFVGVLGGDTTERESQAAAKAARRRRRTNSPQDVEEAWRHHQVAMQDDVQRRRATMYVANQMNVSRATASRLLARARQKEGE